MEILLALAVTCLARRNATPIGDEMPEAVIWVLSRLVIAAVCIGVVLTLLTPGT